MEGQYPNAAYIRLDFEDAEIIFEAVLGGHSPVLGDLKSKELDLLARVQSAMERANAKVGTPTGSKMSPGTEIQGVFGRSNH